MFVDIRAMGFALTEAIRRHVETRVGSALGPCASSVLTVTARLEDINADRGGIDKRCNLVAVIRGRGVLVAESIRQDLYAAIDEASGRIRRSVQRHLTRRIARQRKDHPRPGALPMPG